MTQRTFNLISLKKKILKDADECGMNSLYAKRLYYQQQRSMLLSNFYQNSGILPPHSISPSCNKMEIQTSDDPSMETQVNTENEGENMFTFKDSATQPPMNQSPVNSSKILNDVSNPENEIPRSVKPSSVVEPKTDVHFFDNNTSTPVKRLKNSQSNYSNDRYIPTRNGRAWQTRFSMLSDTKGSCTKRCKDTSSSSAAFETNREVYLPYHSLLKNELLDTNIDGIKSQCEEKVTNTDNNKTSLFQYNSATKIEANIESVAPYSLSPVGPNSQKLLRSPRKPTRKISKIPFKVLDAPELQDDFYLNLVDWSSQNVLGVGLSSCVYLWCASSSQVTRLCDLSHDANSVTSVSWNERGNFVAVGTHNGYIQIWDVAVGKLVNKLTGHSARVGALAWNGDVLSSGSRDRLILQKDIRISSSSNNERRLSAHRQEVCGLKWSPDNQHLASGGNDNKLYVWNMHSLTPTQTYTEHLAAVKAIAWSPHHHGLLASGGGTADRCLRFWNTLTGQPVQCIDTGSQVCNLAWSKHSSELVSTHGYSQNQVLIWKYPTLTQVAKLTGHSYRVLYLAMSPDGEAIVTGAGDETLRFWNVFSKVRSQKENKSVLSLFGNIR